MRKIRKKYKKQSQRENCQRKQIKILKRDDKKTDEREAENQYKKQKY